MASAHTDTFARDHLPPPEAQPDYLFELPSLQFPAQLNCATELLDRAVAEGRGERPPLLPSRQPSGQARSPTAAGSAVSVRSLARVESSGSCRLRLTRAA